jgi:hypothetical protein
MNHRVICVCVCVGYKRRNKKPQNKKLKYFGNDVIHHLSLIALTHPFKKQKKLPGILNLFQKIICANYFSIFFSSRK